MLGPAARFSARAVVAASLFFAYSSPALRRARHGYAPYPRFAVLALKIAVRDRDAAKISAVLAQTLAVYADTDAEHRRLVGVLAVLLFALVWFYV